MSWNLKDKDGKYRSRRAFKQDCAQQSREPWEKSQEKANELMYRFNDLEQESRVLKRKLKKY